MPERRGDCTPHFALRDCPLPEHLLQCDTPQHAADYWRQCIVPTPHYDADKECFVVLLLTARRRVKGHHVVGVGLLDQVLVHAREVFRPAIIGRQLRQRHGGWRGFRHGGSKRTGLRPVNGAGREVVPKTKAGPNSGGAGVVARRRFGGPVGQRRTGSLNAGRSGETSRFQELE
jgi:hypothetical protein